MRGRKPYPHSIMAETNDKNRLTKLELRKREMNEPKVNSTSLACPEHLCEDAKAEWHRIVDIYGELKTPILTDLDINALEVYCEAIVTYRRAMQKVRETSEVYNSRNDPKPRKNPWLTVANEAAIQIKKYGEILLLDPVSRARVGLAKTKDEVLSPMAKFMRDRQIGRFSNPELLRDSITAEYTEVKDD